MGHTSGRTSARAFQRRLANAAGDLYLTRTDELVLQHLDADRRCTAQRLAEALGVSEITIRRSFRRLREHGLIVRIGSNKAGFWKVCF